MFSMLITSCSDVSPNLETDIRVKASPVNILLACTSNKFPYDSSRHGVHPG